MPESTPRDMPTHGVHVIPGEIPEGVVPPSTSMTPPPQGDAALRERLVRALARTVYRDADPRPHVLAICQPWADEIARDMQAWAAEQTQRAEQAEATVQRARDLAEAALPDWKTEHEYHQERWRRKGYTHHEVGAEAYGSAIETLTEILAALDRPEGT